MSRNSPSPLFFFRMRMEFYIHSHFYTYRSSVNPDSQLNCFSFSIFDVFKHTMDSKNLCDATDWKSLLLCLLTECDLTVRQVWKKHEDVE